VNDDYVIAAPTTRKEEKMMMMLLQSILTRRATGSKFHVKRRTPSSPNVSLGFLVLFPPVQEGNCLLLLSLVVGFTVS